MFKEKRLERREVELEERVERRYFWGWGDFEVYLYFGLRGRIGAFGRDEGM